MLYVGVCRCKIPHTLKDKAWHASSFIRRIFIDLKDAFQKYAFKYMLNFFLLVLYEIEKDELLVHTCYKFYDCYYLV